MVDVNAENPEIALIVECEKAGAEAKAHGLSVFDSPYYRLENLPSKTGETITQWSVKAEAWLRGYNLEALVHM